MLHSPVDACTDGRYPRGKESESACERDEGRGVRVIGVAFALSQSTVTDGRGDELVRGGGQTFNVVYLRQYRELGVEISPGSASD